MRKLFFSISLVFTIFFCITTLTSCDEEGFVKERIALRLRTQQLFDDTDVLIEKTEKMLDVFDKDDARRNALGKKLGFDF